MKAILLGIACTALALSSHAQYKKASFFNKSGRTIGLTATGLSMSNGKATAPGILYMCGKEKSEKHLFHWFDIGVILPYKYTYQTIGTPSSPANSQPKNVTLSGKTGISIAFDQNWGYFLMKPTADGNNTVQPYVFAGVSAVLLSGSTNLDDYNYYDVQKYPSSGGLSLGLRGGLGCLFNITDRMGVKAEGGYTAQTNIGASSYSSNKDAYYYPYNNNLQVSVGFRFKFIHND